MKSPSMNANPSVADPVLSPFVRFIGPRNVRLTRHWWVAVPQGTLLVRAGAESDGASIPRVLWGIPGLAAFDGQTFAAAFAHDQLYAAELVERPVADAIFHALLRRCGVGAFRAWVMYQAVRSFGGGAWSSHTSDSIEQARRYAKWQRRAVPF
jgi:hypothetical protein